MNDAEFVNDDARRLAEGARRQDRAKRYVAVDGAFVDAPAAPRPPKVARRDAAPGASALGRLLAAHDEGGDAPAALWPELFDVIDAAEQALTGSYAFDRGDALSCLERLPKTPMRFLANLLAIGLCGHEYAGPARARRLLGDAETATGALLTALGHEDAGLRARAAAWLGERGDPAVRTPLKARLAREDAAPARAQILIALERLGSPIDLGLDPAALSADAERAAKAVKKTKLLAALKPDLPSLRFRDGAAVPEALLVVWIDDAIRAEAPGGSPLTDQYLDLLDPADAETFSQWALEGWIGHDVAKPTDAQAAKKALKALGAPAGAPPPDKDPMFEKLKTRALSKYVNNGYSSRGALALAARAPKDKAGFAIRAYLERHGARHGTRVAQARATLDLAARIGGPACLETLAWTSAQTKHDELAQRAGRQLKEIQARHGWSDDELADRLAPDLGFDADGKKAFVVRDGAPAYEIRLDETPAAQLFNASGRSVKAPPAGKDDEAKAARRAFSDLKKHLEKTVAAQTDRLFAAMCVARVWPAAQWERRVRAHPVLGRLAQRLAWLARWKGGAVLFRPTAEGDLTDAADAIVALPPEAEIRVAHRYWTTEEEAAAWLAHFADYEVAPLLRQFGRPLHSLEALGGDKTGMKLRSGWSMETGALLRAAARFGYAPAGAGASLLRFSAASAIDRRGAGDAAGGWAVAARGRIGASVAARIRQAARGAAAHSALGMLERRA